MMRARMNIEQQVDGRELGVALRPGRSALWHDRLLNVLHQWSIPTLRVALGLIFLWFGLLKLFGTSPVTSILKQTFQFMPLPAFTIGLGVGEVLIGCGLIMKRALRLTLVLLCLHMTGTFLSMLLLPSLFFQHGSLLSLTMEGEFVVKNMVLMAAGLVIAGYEVAPMCEAERRANAEADGIEGDGALVFIGNRKRRREAALLTPE